VFWTSKNGTVDEIFEYRGEKQRRLVHVPMERFSLAEEITKGVLFLAFDEIKVKVKF
jgi:hypothetical protein